MSIISQLKFHSVEPTSVSLGYESTSNSLKVISVSNGAQRWEFTLTSQWLPLDKFRAVWAEINAIYGNKETFEQVLPVFSDAQGAITGQITPKLNYSKGSKHIQFNNFTPLAGDFFRVANHSKVYQVRRVSLGIAEIFPPLLKSVSSSYVVTANGLPFTVRLSGKPKKMKVNKKQIVRIVLPCVEDI